MHKVFCLLFLLLPAVAGAAPIAGFRAGLNWTGFDPGPNGDGSESFTYIPLNGNTGTFKDEYINAVAANLAPKVGRDMDLKQLVTNNMVNWSDMTSLTTDYGPDGVRETTSINVAKQMRAKVSDFTPQVGIPLMATTDYARQQGKLWAQQYGNRPVEINLGNEVWNVFAGNLGAWNLNQAHAEGYVGDDFRILGLRQGVRLAQHAQAFMQGFTEGGGNAANVSTIIEGFAPVPQYIQNQIDGMKSVGITPASLHARLSIAQYAAGSATDLTGPLTTNANKRDAVLAFINAGPAVWSAQTLAIAKANQLAPYVDAYEMRLGGKPVSTPAETFDWVAFQNTDEEQQAQDAGLRILSQASGGVGAIFNAEGYYGFPMDAPQGQFPLLGLDQFNNPNASGAYRGVAGVIDFSSIPGVPEPSTLAVAALSVAHALVRRRAIRQPRR